MTTPATLIRPLQHPPLQALLQQRTRQPFVWGATDCVLWVADAWLALGGADLAADVRGKYHDRRSALRLLRRLGAPDLASLVCRRLQPVNSSPRDGDIALGRPGAAAAPGALAIRLHGYAIGQGPAGLVEVPPTQIGSWWRAAA